MCYSFQLLGETNSTLLGSAAIMGDAFIPACSPQGLADLSAAFSTYGLVTHRVHQEILEAAAWKLRGGMGGGQGEGEEERGEGEGEGADEGGDDVFTDEQLERVVRGLLVRRGEVDFAPLLTAVEVSFGRGIGQQLWRGDAQSCWLEGGLQQQQLWRGD